MPPQRRTRLYFDGGCRPNPGPMEAALVLRGVTHLFDDLGHGSSSDAEWLALIRGVELARNVGLNTIDLLGDALPVIREASTALATSSAPHRHAAAFLAAAAGLGRVRIRWIRRTQNLAGIALAARHAR